MRYDQHWICIVFDRFNEFRNLHNATKHVTNSLFHNFSLLSLKVAFSSRVFYHVRYETKSKSCTFDCSLFVVNLHRYVTEVINYVSDEISTWCVNEFTRPMFKYFIHVDIIIFPWHTLLLHKIYQPVIQIAALWESEYMRYCMHTQFELVNNFSFYLVRIKGAKLQEYYFWTTIKYCNRYKMSRRDLF